MNGTLFDRYIAVDWSANNQPKVGKDSIWVAAATPSDDPIATTNFPTRHHTECWLRSHLEAAVRAGERVLVGMDFPYGYPTGFAAALGGESSWRYVWRYLADRVKDDASNRSNRFAVAATINEALGPAAPFWGRPASQPYDHLSEKKTVRYGSLLEWRRAERTLHGMGWYPQSVWKLAYAGSVGSQALLGIPVVHRLRSGDDLRDLSVVWPFEVVLPAYSVGSPAIVHAEIWPSGIAFAHETGICPDERQVRAVVQLWRKQDLAGTLGNVFAAVPDDEDVLREEGWILGIGSPDYALQSPLRRKTPTIDERPSHQADGGGYRRCECGCGAPGPGRFRPGHDAKLRSRLTKALAAGDADARARLHELGWWR